MYESDVNWTFRPLVNWHYLTSKRFQGDKQILKVYVLVKASHTCNYEVIKLCKCFENFMHIASCEIRVVLFSSSPSRLHVYMQKM